jgi:D-arabinose 1-dehydrogenase-like Zn-dependent alcohol dehydrogenase
MATTEVAVAPMKVAQVPAPGADFQIVEREIPDPDAGHVRIKVQACGVCHSDVLTKEGSWPGIQYPRVPGHEVVGVVDEVGAGVSVWTKGQGVGGLGHLGIQFANKFGYRVAAIGRGSENAVLAKKLGATVYIDSRATNAAEELQKLGGARVILATAPSSKAMTELIDGLGPNGRLMVIGADFAPIEVTPVQLISGSRTIQGWASGTPTDSEDTLRFAELTGVRPMIETYPLEKAAEAYARMMSGDAQFRVVLTM